MEMIQEPSEKITIDDLSVHTGLPAKFLIGLGLRDGSQGVTISYGERDGGRPHRHRIRTALGAKDGSSWSSGEGKIVPYGLWRLHRADKGYVVLVEGESDAWTLWFHNFPCLGLPGADTARFLEANYLDRITRLYAVQEPDEGGPRFIGEVGQRLKEIGWTGELYVITLPDLEDIGELFKSDAEAFESRFQQAMTEARRARASARKEGALLLKEIEQFYSKYLVLPARTVLPLAVWTLATWCFAEFECFPYLAIMSPVKRCGKTRLTEVVSLIAARALRTVNISEAALFRLIQRDAPTLIMDESEALTGRSDRAEAIRSLLNAGNRRDAKVPRCVGREHEVKLFSVYCPKVIVGIGTCPDTVRDRSIEIRMQRKRHDQTVARFLMRVAGPHAEQIKGQAASLIGRLVTEISAAYNLLDVDLSRLEDRDCEMFEPLFAVLSVVDSSRTDELMKCARLLTQRKAKADQDDSIAIKLLADIRAVWPKEQHQVFSRDLISALKNLRESPWVDEELTQRKLADILRPFEVAPTGVRTRKNTAKGYRLSDLEGVFLRYLVVNPSHASQGA